mgnify:CR=1 FL=1
MRKEIAEFIMEAATNPIFRLVAILIVFDTIMGVFRAIKEKRFNSCIGINGAIRKAAMIVSLLFLALADTVLSLNLIGFIPVEVWQAIGMASPATIGMAEFFALLFIAYEVVSVLKNMTLAGLPMKRVWEYVKGFLSKFTDEMPDDD